MGQTHSTCGSSMSVLNDPPGGGGGGATRFLVATLIASAGLLMMLLAQSLVMHVAFRTALHAAVNDALIKRMHELKMASVRFACVGWSLSGTGQAVSLLVCVRIMRAMLLAADMRRPVSTRLQMAQARAQHRRDRRLLTVSQAGSKLTPKAVILFAE